MPCRPSETPNASASAFGVIKIADVVEGSQPDPAQRQPFAVALLDAYDRLRGTYGPGKKPDWHAAAFERHSGRLLRLIGGFEPWPDAWRPDAPNGIPAPHRPDDAPLPKLVRTRAPKFSEGGEAL